MTTQETNSSPAELTSQFSVRQRAESLRAEHAARTFHALYRLIARGYARLASHGAGIPSPRRAPTGLF
jgi:hypothetical protein